MVLLYVDKEVAMTITNEKNQILYPDRMSQAVSYAGMDYPDGAFPTDIDGLIEWKDKGYILYELKFEGKQLSGGQRVAMTRMIDDLSHSGKLCMLMVADHKNPISEFISLKDAVVRNVYVAESGKGVWSSCYNGKCNAKQLTDRYISILNKRTRPKK